MATWMHRPVFLQRLAEPRAFKGVESRSHRGPLFWPQTCMPQHCSRLAARRRDHGRRAAGAAGVTSRQSMEDLQPGRRLR
eukprot:351491-Chlamydomonas_euryale.AAC.19